MTAASMFIGRYQPFHQGHKTLIDTVLNEGNDVVIALRDTPIQDTDPYTVMERFNMIREIYPNAVMYPSTGRIVVCAIPDISEVVYGRKVGWGVRQVQLDKETESISATKIREEMKNEDRHKGDNKN